MDFLQHIQNKVLQSNQKIQKLKTRIIIDHIAPEIDGGAFPVKRVVGEEVKVDANVFIDGHEELTVKLLYKRESENDWHEILMTPSWDHMWHAAFPVKYQEPYYYTVQAWVDDFGYWRNKLQKKWDDGQDILVDLKEGAKLLRETVVLSGIHHSMKLKKWAEDFLNPEKVERSVQTALSNELDEIMRAYPAKRMLSAYDKILKVTVDRKKALFSAWYEFFPRSWSKDPDKHGTFKDGTFLLPEIARMGFDVIYLPPIHPIGRTHRKGKNNATKCAPGDPGSPWAIGAQEGGHKSIHPELGTLEDFKLFIAKAKKLGMEVAMDLAFQCSPDHPYVKEHPQWFKHRPDGTVQYAENPPKKYEDIYPLNFETEDYESLCLELKSVVDYWIEQGIRIFRVDNPHTKPVMFWEWLIKQVKSEQPDVLFLAEAFTKSSMMKRLAKIGFDQSYTYFTWRNTKYEFEEYMKELTRTEMKEYFRPNFWPNTPDILTGHLIHGGRPAFISRLVLAAMLSSNYGIYGPAFELCENDLYPGKEEYAYSEKYEIKQWNWKKEGHLKDVIALVNKSRKENPALQETNNIQFCPTNNDQILCFVKKTGDLSNIIVVAVNLDPYHVQSGWVSLPLNDMGLDWNKEFKVKDLLSRDEFTWRGEHNFIQLNPHAFPAHVLKVTSV